MVDWVMIEYRWLACYVTCTYLRHRTPTNYILWNVTITITCEFDLGRVEVCLADLVRRQSATLQTLLMAWQKTFSLSKRAKGCYLVTEEILAQISQGLQGIQASSHFLRYHFHPDFIFQAGMLFLFMSVVYRRL